MANGAQNRITAPTPGAAPTFVMTAGVEHDRSVIPPTLLLPASIRTGSAFGNQATANPRVSDSQPGYRGLVCFSGLQGTWAGNGRDRSCGLGAQIVGAQALGAAIVGDDFNTGHVAGAAGLSVTARGYRPLRR